MPAQTTISTVDTADEQHQQRRDLKAMLRAAEALGIAVEHARRHADGSNARMQQQMAAAYGRL
jgi:hypothetical protein